MCQDSNRVRSGQPIRRCLLSIEALAKTDDKGESPGDGYGLEESSEEDWGYRMKVFISSVQTEFAREREMLGDYLSGDPLLRRFFETFIFERDVPAADRRPDEVYLEKVAQCDLYIGLFGREYGSENADCFSPTHLEYNEATNRGKTRLIFVKGADDEGKHPKMQRLIREAGSQLVRRRFNKPAELQAAVYASLVDYLEVTGNLNRAPWDARAARRATLDDLDMEAITSFVRHARKARGFPLPVTAEIKEVLTHLDLLDNGVPTNAATLLFGKYPQRFAITSQVKCAHFHGTEVAKPIPSHQEYKGTAFALVDQAIDFVMSKINLSVGTRAHGPQAPVKYEIPRDVVAEAIAKGGLEAVQYNIALEQVKGISRIAGGQGTQTIVVPADAVDAFGKAFAMLKGRG